MAAHLPPGVSPDAVDALTELTTIVTRLRAAYQQQQQQQQQQQPSTTAGATGPPISAPRPVPSGTQPPATSTPAPQGVTGTTPLPTTTPGGTPSGGGGGGGPTSSSATHNQQLHPQQASSSSSSSPSPREFLSAKDLPQATDNLKHKLQRARAAMRTLEDAQRSIAQQEVEIAAAEARRAAQAARLARTQEDGLQFVRTEGLRAGEGEGGMPPLELGATPAADRMVE